MAKNQPEEMSMEELTRGICEAFAQHNKVNITLTSGKKVAGTIYSMHLAENWLILSENKDSLVKVSDIINIY